MLGPTHRLTGAVAGAGWAVYTDQPTLSVALAALVATASSAGWGSPDVDQSGPFVWAGRALGPAGRLVAHRRGITHWWALPLAAWMWAVPGLPGEVAWSATALLLGWMSHLAGDAVFGRVPIAPGWGPMVGLGLRTGGWVETGQRAGRSGGRGGLPFSPARAVLLTALAWLLAGAPTIALSLR